MMNADDVITRAAEAINDDADRFRNLVTVTNNCMDAIKRATQAEADRDKWRDRYEACEAECSDLREERDQALAERDALAMPPALRRALDGDE